MTWLMEKTLNLHLKLGCRNKNGNTKLEKYSKAKCNCLGMRTNLCTQAVESHARQETEQKFCRKSRVVYWIII